MTVIEKQMNLNDTDVGIILHNDGTFEMFSVEPNREFSMDNAQDKTALSLCIALKYPVIMDLLHDIATDPIFETLDNDNG